MMKFRFALLIAFAFVVVPNFVGPQELGPKEIVVDSNTCPGCL